MKQMQKSFFALVVLLVTANAMASSNSTTFNGSCPGASPWIYVRSQGVNVARDIVGWEELINLCDMDKFYGAFAITGEFDQSFRSGQIARSIFGNDVAVNNCCNTVVSAGSTTTTSSCNTGCNTGCGSGCGRDGGRFGDRDDCAVLNISGSSVANRGANDWLADYFGLPTDFQSQVFFSPRIKSFTADVAFYLGLDEWADGLYFRINFPIAWTRWDLRFCEQNITTGTEAYPAGYFSSDVVEASSLLTNATDFFSGNAVPTLGGDPNVVFDPLTASKWSTNGCDCRGLSKTRLAAVNMDFGWNFLCCEDYHFGLKIRASAPTGNRYHGEFLFEPIVGNGHHWELGGGVSAHAVLWRCDETDNSFSLYLEANVTHLFRTCQTLTFDLCGLPNSRYMLAERMTTSLPTGLSGDATPATFAGTLSDAQFANEFSPVANLTRRQVDVSFAVQGDVALKFAYATGCGFEWDLGYNFWGVSCAKICQKTGCNQFDPLADGMTWALKGDAYVYGFVESDGAPQALGATESLATIHAGTNASASLTPDTSAPDTNPNIDNPLFAYVTIPADSQVAVDPTGDVPQRTSIQPVFLSDANLNLSGGKGISHKIFTNFSYSWKDCEDWTPFLGVGASAEFTQNNRNCCGDNGFNGCNTGCSTTSTTPVLTNCNSCCGNGSGIGRGGRDNLGDCRATNVSQWGVWIKGGVAFN